MSIASIQQIFALYCQHLDAGRLDDVAKLFADDGILIMEEFGVRETGIPAIRARYDQISDPKLKHVHSTFNHVIDIEDKAASAVVDFILINIDQAPRIVAIGKYRARFAEIASEWKIKEYRIELRSFVRSRPEE